jgi:hypothetical protein
MTLKSLRLARAEDLPEQTRIDYKLPPTGLIAIETRNPDLRENIIPIKNGFYSYIKSLGDFKEISID